MANIRIPLDDSPPCRRLANLRRHPLGHDRYIRLVNELGQSAAEFDAAGYPMLAAAAVAARNTVQVLWTATRDVEKAEEPEIEEAGITKVNVLTPTVCPS